MYVVHGLCGGEFDHELDNGCGWLGWSGAAELFVAALKQPDLADYFFSYSPTLVCRYTLIQGGLWACPSVV